MTIRSRNPTVIGFRNSALVLAFAGLLFGAGTTAASADETTLVPTPEPQGPIARTANGDAGAPVEPVTPPGNGPCFSCAPNQISDSPPAVGPGPTPTVSPVLTHSNSGANHEQLTVDGVDFTPKQRVDFVLQPTNAGDFDPESKYRFATDSGSVQVTFADQTVPPRGGGKSGFVVATD